jgi:hypothetical protein
MNWKIEPTLKKSVVELVTYSNDGDTFVYASYYRWAEIFISNETKPVFEYTEDDDGVKFQEQDHNLYDCYSSCFVDFSEGMQEHVKEEIIDFVDEHGISKLEEEEGWEYDESEIWIYGTLQIHKI